MEFRVLGPVQVLEGQRAIPVPAGRVRSLLAVLLLRANQVVTVQELVGQLWDESPPAHPRAAIQTYIGRLRQAVGGRLIQTTPSGYQIELDPAQLDLTRFRRLVEQADQVADPARQAGLLGQALELWRGQPLADVSSEPVLREEVPRLVEERLHAVEQLLDARLRRGEHAQVVAPLTSLTQEHPLRERCWAQLMLALYRCGRQADALAAYQAISRLLADELGIDPGEELQHLRQAILTGEAQFTAAPTETASREQYWATQCQLPLDVADFVGRDTATAEILNLVRTPVPRPAVLIVAISGPPGVGKSALAIRAAHALRSDLPDGQWYLRLNGASGRPRSPAELLDNLLRNAGVEPTAIPADVSPRAALFRARVADRRLLMVLDDATDTAQVEQLLPGTPGCVVIVTSRSDLGGLIATHGARRLAVTELAAHEANELLIRMLGARRVQAEPAAAADIARLCGYLPLALRIAAANLAGRPSVSLAHYAAGLGGTDRLDKLVCTDDAQVAVRAAFALSYAALTAPLQHAFRLLGWVPGPDFDKYAIAALLGVTDQYAEDVLDRLTAANLVERRGAHRYGLHDLIRLYATERATTDEPKAAREPARRRLLDWYLHTAKAAVTAMHAAVKPPVLPEPGATVRPRSFGTDRDALAWLDQERSNLVAAISEAAASARSSHAALLAGVLRSYFDSGCHFDEWSTALSAGLRAAEHADPLNRIRLHNDQGVLHWREGRYPDAIADFNSGLTVGVESGTRDLEGRILNNLGAVHNELLMPNEAAHYLDRALDALRSFAADDQATQSIILANLGNTYSNLGKFDLALHYTNESLAIAREDGARRWYGEGFALEVLGEAYLWLGELEPAHEHLTRALEIFQKHGFRTEEGYVLDVLSAVHRAAGRNALALDCGHIVLDIFQEIGNRRHIANAHNSIGASLYQLNHPGKALEHFSTARGLIDDLNHHKGRIVALTGLALAGHKIDADAGYAHYAEQALALAQQAQHAVLQGKALEALAWISLSDGRHTDAAAHGERAIAIHRRTGCRGMLADALVIYGKAQIRQGHLAAAVALWREALTLYEALDSPHAAEVRAELATADPAG
ncbi:MAG TPA: BTAD domain-containing putative transcriptional regulator [Pseudonocardiaceae bacterium]|nr:BTAD domain-containing putative transcriptional regulator [Pseudonocardiaceae bacterium]